MDEPKVSAIVVTYRSAATVRATLDGLRAARDVGLLSRCILVDNDSDDGTVTVVREHHAWTEIVPAGRNLGFGRGVNLGLERIKTPYVLLLNPDATLLPDALQRLVAFLDGHAKVGIAGPVLLDAQGQPQPVQPLPTPGRLLAQALGLQSHGTWALPPGSGRRRVDWLCGAALLVRTELLKRLDGFDPRFFLYFEETDLCVRAAARGVETWLVGDAVAHHAAHHSARGEDTALVHGCLPQHFFPSRFHYLSKHHGWPIAAAVDVTDLALTGVRYLVRRLRRDARLGELVAALRAPRLRPPPRGAVVGAIAGAIVEPDAK